MNLQGYRKKKKLTQDELAKEVGVSQAYICALEKGQKNNPSVRVLINIAKALDTTLDELAADREKVV